MRNKMVYKNCVTCHIKSYDSRLYNCQASISPSSTKYLTPMPMFEMCLPPCALLRLVGDGENCVIIAAAGDLSLSGLHEWMGSRVHADQLRHVQATLGVGCKWRRQCWGAVCNDLSWMLYLPD